MRWCLAVLFLIFVEFSVYGLQPVVVDVSIPNVSMKIGDVVTATITVQSDSATYTLGTGSDIGGYSLGSLTKLDSTTYTAQFTITEGGTDYAATDDIPTNVTLADGGLTDTWNTPISQDSDPIDANRPAKPAAPDLAASSDEGASSSDDITNDNTPTFQGGVGAAEAGSTVTVTSSIDGVLGTTAANVDGSWLLPVSTPMSDGTHDITVTATDAAGNVSGSSDPLAVLIDTEDPPPPTGRDPLNNTYTNDNTPTFSWDAVADPGGSGVRDYHIIVYDLTHAQVKSSYPSAAHYTPSSRYPLADGVYTWKLATRDIAGNTGPWSDELTLTVDTVKPTITTVTPSPATIAEADAGPGRFTITVDYSEAMDMTVDPEISFPGEDPSFTITFDHGGWTNADTYVAYYDVADTDQELAEVDVRVSGGEDPAGNIQDPADHPDLFTIDTEAPELVSIVSSTTDGCYNVGDDIDVAVNFSEDVTLTGGTLDVTLDSGATVGIGPFGPAGSGSAIYTVGAGEDSCDLDAIGVALNGGTLRDDAGNDAVIALPGTTIADGSDIVVDTADPVIDDLAFFTDDTYATTTTDYYVDDSCLTTVYFAAAVTDNCCIDPDNVEVAVTLPTGNAILENVIVDRIPSGQGRVDITGSADVRCLTGCPARVEVQINATDCCGNAAVPLTSADIEGLVRDEISPTAIDDPNGDEDRSSSDGLEVRVDDYGRHRLMVRQNTPVRIDLVANDTDNCSACACCGTVWIHDIVDQPQYGTVSIESDHGDCNGGSVVRYAPYRDSIGPDRFTYRTEDACGNVSDIATVYVEVVRQTALEDLYLSGCGGEGIDFEIAATDIWLNPGNPNEIPFEFTIDSLPVHGVILGDLADVTYAPHGRTTKEIESASIGLLYVPAEGFTGRDAAMIRFSDPFGGSSTALVDIAVVGCEGRGSATVCLHRGSILPIYVPAAFTGAYESGDVAWALIGEDGLSYPDAISVAWDERLGAYVLMLDTGGLEPGVYEVKIPLGTGGVARFSLEVEG